VWYPGSEPGGGSFIAQRMLASKSEKDSLGAVLFFNIAHYILRPWPWILVALCSLIVYPNLSDIKAAFPNLDPALLGHDIAYPAMLKFLPVGFVGLMVGGLIAANSSTLLTLLNWGASYLVHDFYQRFVKPGASEKHYVMTARVATIVLFLFSSAVVYLMDSAKNSFDIMLQVGAGTGLLYLLRWFWWRITAWCEVVAMISSFGASITLLVLNKNGIGFSTDHALLITVIVTTICWVVTALVGPQTDRAILIDFYKRVRPFGPGWEIIRKQAGLPKSSSGENIPLAMIGWSSGCALIWSALFAIGNYLYGRTTVAIELMCLAIVTAAILIWTVNRLWTAAPIAPEKVSKATTATV
ncbi:MAG: sodium:solute symporter family transporter, partial [Limisphaerales bacterium]